MHVLYFVCLKAFVRFNPACVLILQVAIKPSWSARQWRSTDEKKKQTRAKDASDFPSPSLFIFFFFFFFSFSTEPVQQANKSILSECRSAHCVLEPSCLSPALHCRQCRHATGRRFIPPFNSRLHAAPCWRLHQGRSFAVWSCTARFLRPRSLEAHLLGSVFVCSLVLWYFSLYSAIRYNL